MGPFQKRSPLTQAAAASNQKKFCWPLLPHPPTSREKGKKRKIITTQKSLFLISVLGVYVRMTNVSRPDFCPRAVKRGAMPPENLGHWFWAAGTCPIVEGRQTHCATFDKIFFFLGEVQKSRHNFDRLCFWNKYLCKGFFSNSFKAGECRSHCHRCCTQNQLSSKTCPILLPSKPAQNHPVKLIITETGTENGHSRQKKRRKPN